MPKEYYTGMGFVLGSGIGGLLAIPSHCLTGNPLFAILVAVGGLIGVLIGQHRAIIGETTALNNG